MINFCDIFGRKAPTNNELAHLKQACECCKDNLISAEKEIYRKHYKQIILADNSTAQPDLVDEVFGQFSADSLQQLPVAEFYYPQQKILEGMQHLYTSFNRIRSRPALVKDEMHQIRSLVDDVKNSEDFHEVKLSLERANDINRWADFSFDLAVYPTFHHLIPGEKRDPIKTHIRWMISQDMSQVFNIEKTSFEFPWRENDFIRCLKRTNCIGMVAEADSVVCGYMIYELHKTKLHLLNLAVSPEFRNQDVGSQLIEKLASKLSPERRTRITTEVRESNLPALLFFRKMGFKAVNTFKNAYQETNESSVLFAYRKAA